MSAVDDRDREASGRTRVGSDLRVTIPPHVLAAAGLRTGDRLVARADGAGRVVLVRQDDVLAEFAARLTGVWEPDELARVRGE